MGWLGKDNDRMKDLSENVQKILDTIGELGYILAVKEVWGVYLHRFY